MYPSSPPPRLPQSFGVKNQKCHTPVHTRCRGNGAIERLLSSTRELWNQDQDDIVPRRTRIAYRDVSGEMVAPCDV